MALTRQEIVRSLERLGQLARQRGIQIELSLVGGAVLSLVYRSRDITRDVDAIILAPQEARIVRQLVEIVADEWDWPTDWLNDGAIGYVTRRDELKYGRVIFAKPGIVVRMPKLEQLLAMKLMAWRTDVDVDDAALLLREVVREKRGWFFRPGPGKIWRAVEPYLVPGLKLKAQYAFDELWKAIYG